MLFLLLALLCSSGVSVMLRLSKSKTSDGLGTLLFNYTTCSLLGCWLVFSEGFPQGQPGGGWAAALGILGGFIFLGSLMLMQKNIAVNGLAMSSTFMKMGVLVPTLMAVVFFGEKLRLTQLLGYAVTLYVILTMETNRTSSEKISGKALLLLLLLTGGMSDALPNIFEKTGNAPWNNTFLAMVFCSALCLTLLLFLRKKERVTRWDVICGIGVGIPNYFSTWFTMEALKSVPAVIVYPVYSVGSLAVITLVGRFVFGEQLNRKKWISLLLMASALVLLNL